MAGVGKQLTQFRRHFLFLKGVRIAIRPKSKTQKKKEEKEEEPKTILFTTQSSNYLSERYM